MSAKASAIVQRVWNYAHVLKDDGLSFIEYTEQITYLLFLKLAWERQGAFGGCEIPSRYRWDNLIATPDDAALAKRYDQALKNLSSQPGLLGIIFAKPQSRINDPAKLRRLTQLIDGQDWANLDFDVKGEIYEGLLARNAEDVRGGAGQYFTPRPIIRAIVQVMRPDTQTRIADPACGTGGFLLAAHEYLNRADLTKEERTFLNEEALHGTDIVSSVTRLCAMNLFLHGLSGGKRPLVETTDSLAGTPNKVDMVLTNPPFGKRSSITIIGDDGKQQSEGVYYDRKDFWVTTSNKQLNFLQHVFSMLTQTGKAAIVVPDNVLFEAGAGERVRRKLLEKCDVHTLLRLPTGIWYATGVKANVLFLDKKSESTAPSTDEIWIYDLRTNQHFTQRQNPITNEVLEDFVQAFQANDRRKRKESERFRRFSYDEVLNRYKVNLDISWLKDESLEDGSDLPHPDVLAREIIEDIESALDEFRAAENELSVVFASQHLDLAKH